MPLWQLALAFALGWSLAALSFEDDQVDNGYNEEDSCSD